MTTANDLITLALKDIGVLGVGQSALAEDMNDAFVSLNGMLSIWNRKRYMVYHLVNTAIASTGAQSYSVGVGGDFSIPRPSGIMTAMAGIQTGTVPTDYPLAILTSREDYNRIPSKAIGSFPQYAYYDAAYPLGRVYFWPVPATGYTLTITTPEVLTAFSSLIDAMNLPPEYFEAIRYNLAIRLASAYSIDPSASTIALAKDALQTIRNANAQIPQMEMPSGIPQRGRFNIYSGMVR